MGSSHSHQTRSVSLDNPHPGIIELSDDVINRLKKGVEKQMKEEKAQEKAKPKPSPTPASALQKKEARPVPITKPTPHHAPLAPQPTTIFIPSSGATFTSSDVRRQKDIELQQNDDMWRKRMNDLEIILKKTNSIMEDEYASATEDVRKRFATASPVHQLPPCQELKAKVIACYKANPGETLKCADEVSQFRNCVSMHRVKKLDAEEIAEKSETDKAAMSAPAVKAVKAG